MKKIWQAILSFFGMATGFLKKHEKTAEKAVQAVNIVKGMVETGVADITALTPSAKDDAITTKVKNVLTNKVIPEIIKAEGIIKSTSTNTSAFEAFIAYLQSKDKLARAKWWLELAGQIIKALADGQLTLGEAVAIGQAIYAKVFVK